MMIAIGGFAGRGDSRRVAVAALDEADQALGKLRLDLTHVLAVLVEDFELVSLTRKLDTVARGQFEEPRRLAELDERVGPVLPVSSMKMLGLMRAGSPSRGFGGLYNLGRLLGKVRQALHVLLSDNIVGVELDGSLIGSQGVAITSHFQ